jgi:hypothetical protein
METMRPKNAIRAICFILAPIGLLAQGVRVDSQATTINGAPTGAMAQVLVVPGATVAVCQDSLCTTAATTYTDITLATACPSNAQITLAGSTGCVATTDAQGRFGFWVSQAVYYYEVTLPNGTVYGPYAVTPGGSGSAPFNFSGSTSGALVAIVQSGSGDALDVTGKTTLTGALAVSGASSLAALSISGAFSGTHAQNLGSNDSPTFAAATLTGALTVDGIANSGLENIGGSLAVTGTAAIGGGASVGGTLGVTGIASFSSNVAVSGNLAVTGTAAFGQSSFPLLTWGTGAAGGALNHGTNYVSLTATTTNTGVQIGANGSGVITLESPVTATYAITGPGLIATAAAPTVAASQVGFGGSVAASSDCGSLMSAAGCLVVNVAGATHYVPYY